MSSDAIPSAYLIQYARAMRKKYIYNHPDPKTVGEYPKADQLKALSHYEIRPVNGVYEVYETMTTKCSHDTEEHATTHCRSCNVYLCDDCDRFFHKDPNKRDHKRTAVGNKHSIFPVVPISQFIKEITALKNLSEYGPLLSYTHQRVKILSSKYTVHKHLNEIIEKQVLKVILSRQLQTLIFLKSI